MWGTPLSPGKGKPGLGKRKSLDLVPDRLDVSVAIAPRVLILAQAGRWGCE